MSTADPCIDCGGGPRKSGRRRCSPCQYRHEGVEQQRARQDRWIARTYGSRAAYSMAQRRANGAKPRPTASELKAAAEARDRTREARTRDREKRRVAAIAKAPWKSPGLTEAQAFRLRYSLDPAFRRHQQRRTIIRKYTNPSYGARYGDKRWGRAAMKNDGTVTVDVVEALLDALVCFHCGGALDSSNRSIDHLHPLGMGGAHSAENLVASCRSCNHDGRGQDRSASPPCTPVDGVAVHGA